MKLLLEAGSSASKRFRALRNGIVITCIYILQMGRLEETFADLLFASNYVVGMVQSFVSLRTDGGLRRELGAVDGCFGGVHPALYVFVQGMT